MALDRLESGGIAYIFDGNYDEDLIINDWPVITLVSPS